MAVVSTKWSRLLNTLQIRKDYSQIPAGLSWRSNAFFIVATVAIGLFTDLFLYGLVVPILPFLLRDKVGMPEKQIQSHVSALLAVFAGASVICSPFAGLLADKLSSRQGPFLFGLVVMLIATTLLFTGESVAALVIARGLQGVSGGFVWTIGLALCLETVGPGNLGKTIGSIFSFIGVGNFVAPILGGILYEKTGYIGVYALGASVLVVDLVMRLLVIEKKVARRYRVNYSNTDEDSDETCREDNDSDDESGSTACSEPNEEQPLLGIAKESDDHYRLPETNSTFLRHFPIARCLKDPALLTALLVAFIQAILFGSFDATIPTVAHELFNFDALKSGLLFVPLGASDFILGPLFGWCVDRYGTKPVAVISYLFLIPVLVLLRLPHAGGEDQIILYSGILALGGIGLAGIGAPAIVEAGAIVQRYHEVNPEFFGEVGPYAQLYGLSNMVFSLGLTIGPELSGELKQLIGYGNMNIVLAALCLVTATLSFFYVGGKPRFSNRA